MVVDAASSNATFDGPAARGGAVYGTLYPWLALVLLMI
jgi:hypothetical protein